MTLSSLDIAGITNGRLLGPVDLPAVDIVIDSRQSYYSEGLIFIAISGKNHDGHKFITDLYKSGIRIFVVERIPENTESFNDASFIVVKNTLEALQSLASYKRRQFTSPVIAVTGSAGKTVVKEWLADILGLTAPVIRSPRSYNSQIGVPLSVWKLADKYSFGIFEAGISMPGEMEKLREVINPDIGILTNIGEAHSENFKDEISKAEEKLKLFKNASIIICSRDQKSVSELIFSGKDILSGNIVDWSYEDKNAKIFVSTDISGDDRTSLKLSYSGTTSEFLLPFSDRASVENAISVVSCCLALEVPRDVIRRGIEAVEAVAMRMEMKSGINNCLLIEDFYNSDPGSLGMAVDYLRQQKGRKRTLILSDFIQSDRNEKELYSEVARLIQKAAIDRFIGIGDALVRSKEVFGKNNAAFFHSTDEFISRFNNSEYRDEIILIKGARMFEFERIGQLLEQQMHQTVLEVNLDAMAHNLNEIRRHLNKNTRIMAMVKAFAYGAGPAEIASLMQYHGVSYLGVAYADEGVELRNAGVTIPVMVMNPDPYAFELMIKYSLEPELYSFYSLDQFSKVASRYGLIDFPVHIKIDTGMHRLGFMPHEITKLAELLKGFESIRVVSVFSHLAASEDSSLDHFTKKQLEVFQEAAGIIQSALGYPFLRHILNSSGIVRFPQFQFDMVRPGLAIYGAGKFEGLNIKATGRFRTTISQIKTIAEGEPVGYGCRDKSENKRDIAILPVGYADGLSRLLGNRQGSLFIKGRRVPIIGNVCMDMCMADVTGLDVKVGEEAEIFGDNISIDEIASLCKTIPYEILTSIPSRVKRVFFRE